MDNNRNMIYSNKDTMEGKKGMFEDNKNIQANNKKMMET
jgi:hypothetical protein